MWRIICSVRAAPASSQMSPSRRSDRETGEDRVLLRAVEDRVQPRAELRERARVARELAVDAVEHERDLQQHGAGDQPWAVPGRERGGCHEAQHDRERRHPVGAPAALRCPARDVLRVGADEERGEEAVVGLHRGVQQRLVLVVRADRARPPPRRRQASAGASRTACAGGCRRPGPRTARARRAAARARPARPPRAACSARRRPLGASSTSSGESSFSSSGASGSSSGRLSSPSGWSAPASARL